MLSILVSIGICYRAKRQCPTDVTIDEIAVQLQTTDVIIDKTIAAVL